MKEAHSVRLCKTVITYSFVLIVNSFFSTVVYSDLLLSAPPRESPREGQAVYGPLANYLSKVLGESVYYEHPTNWRNYAKKMRGNKYDIVFDGPHFAAWRINELAAKPLVKLPGSLAFVLVIKSNNDKITTLRDLTGKSICTLASPNLGALTLFSMFPNPARQPEYYIVKRGFKEVAKAFDRGHCEAAILRSSIYYKKLTPKFRQSTIIIKESKAITNQGITVSYRIDKESLQKLVISLTSGEGLTAAKPILERFSRNANAFEPALKKDYQKLNLLRDNSIFGW